MIVLSLTPSSSAVPETLMPLIMQSPTSASRLGSELNPEMPRSRKLEILALA
tara:strand:- start:1006 stop:1161 length:156 start_codon:yes stop_codon:yes gene_type:complete